MRCIGCGCTEQRACRDMENGIIVPCRWVGVDEFPLCSVCAKKAEQLYLQVTGRAA